MSNSPLSGDSAKLQSSEAEVPSVQSVTISQTEITVLEEGERGSTATNTLTTMVSASTTSDDSSVLPVEESTSPASSQDEVVQSATGDAPDDDFDADLADMDLTPRGKQTYPSAPKPIIPKPPSKPPFKPPRG
ncbi:hypothetical protein EW026_g967 [Hermanssonia centrifuga]|uniref:Uncharacterized protein n=1 Tax=Hermanssonia centrifuga TaxID=98765 RepID=A0A4S4KT07_9APHY|nr:hypothetical protein EW026_g967 [Hermanssonia centrifuga]